MIPHPPWDSLVRRLPGCHVVYLLSNIHKALKQRYVYIVALKPPVSQCQGQTLQCPIQSEGCMTISLIRMSLLLVSTYVVCERLSVMQVVEILVHKSQFTLNSGGSKGGAPGVCPPTVQNFLNFMQFFGKFDKIIGWRPLSGGLAPPPTGNPGSAPAPAPNFPPLRPPQTSAETMHALQGLDFNLELSHKVCYEVTFTSQTSYPTRPGIHWCGDCQGVTWCTCSVIYIRP